MKKIRTTCLRVGKETITPTEDANGDPNAK
jgi:hypothetical protein